MTSLFDVSDPLTLKLAPLIGAFMVASAAGFLRKTSRAQSYLRELSASTAIGRLVGAFALIGGGLIILYHSDFTSLTASLVSALGIFWTLEGFALLAIPDRLPLRSEGTINQFRMLQFAGLAMGVILLLAGLVGQVTL